ncbi:MAG: BlaI/MecI/CopY family transcriptional regulator [Prevotella sp.]|jgi:predicted transcriptional regulator|nr:BlaI/MecI/CopY family transcriptional regulator [Prevotella sp.]MBO7538218.1 BlaI/MecI/CopY family transcriptional regulator [Prevotella sp.]
MKQQTLTKSEMQVMNILWSLDRGACVNDILAQYPDPKPAYTTIATFLKILTQKGFIEYKKGTGKLLIYSPLITKEKYRRQVMEEVKDDFFGNSFKSMFSFFVREEHLTAEEIQELIDQIKEEEKI